MKTLKKIKLRWKQVKILAMKEIKAKIDRKFNEDMKIVLEFILNEQSGLDNITRHNYQKVLDRMNLELQDDAERIKELKEIFLEIWMHFRDHPDLCEKESLPNRLYSKIEHLEQQCPLCELYHVDTDCEGCPIERMGGCYYYAMWRQSASQLERRIWASIMVDLVARWEG